MKYTTTQAELGAALVALLTLAGALVALERLAEARK
jgi:hypothetical protein